MKLSKNALFEVLGGAASCKCRCAVNASNLSCEKYKENEEDEEGTPIK